MEFLLNKKKWISVAKGLGIALAGAAATYLAQIAGNVDFGAMTPMVVALMSVAVNYLRKVVEENEDEDEDEDEEEGED